MHDFFSWESVEFLFPVILITPLRLAARCHDGGHKGDTNHKYKKCFHIIGPPVLNTYVHYKLK